jgi:hypothetical protein
MELPRRSQIIINDLVIATQHVTKYVKRTTNII